MELTDAARAVAERARAAGGRALVVGGAVRDRLLGLQPADFDIEVAGVDPARVLALADGLGQVRDVGKAFGVLECRMGSSILHISVPRRDSKIAPGHRGFLVGADPAMSPWEAARRRDFTVNAIAEDPLTGEVTDPFGGRADLERKVLRVVDERTFGDDPLRVLRGAVFAAQFELQVDPASEPVLRGAVPSLRELPRTRVGEEWRKLLLRPARPSEGLELLMRWGALAVLHADFVRLPATPQNPTWHPEGDVWTHTKMAVDEAAALVRWRDLASDDRWRVLLATLCHDLGKVTTTVRDVRGRLRSVGHDAAGVQPTQRFLYAIAADRRTRGVVVSLVREHLQPLHFFNAAARGKPWSDGVLRRLARRLHPATIFLLTLVADADHRGRGRPQTSEVSPSTSEVQRTTSRIGDTLRERAAALGVLDGLPQPVLSGSDLVALGLPPGPAFGEILRRAEELRDERGDNRETLRERLRGAASTDEALARLG